MSDYPQRIFSIHFPHKKVYIENTCKTFNDKMDIIKNDKDHLIYPLLKVYPNPETRFECFQDSFNSKNKQEVAKEYYEDNYEILNVNLLPPSKFNLFQSLYKWMGY